MKILFYVGITLYSATTGQLVQSVWTFETDVALGIWMQLEISFTALGDEVIGGIRSH